MLGRNVLQLIGALTVLVGVVLVWSARAYRTWSRPWAFHFLQGLGIVVLGIMITIRFRDGWWLTPLAAVSVVALVAALFMHPRRGETRRSPSGDPGKR